MKYSHRSNYRKTCPHDPQTRAQLGSRLHYARIRLGWSIEDAGKYFQVTDRTWHNWECGAHRIPYAVYKLLRVLARLELPGKAWAGWRLEGDVLITPEGRQIAPQDGSWWSLLVRRADGFDAAYTEAARLRKLLNSAAADGQHGQAQAPVRPAVAPENGSLPLKLGHATVNYASLSSQPSHPRCVSAPHGNHGDIKPIIGPAWGQSDTMMAPWPLISDSLLPSISLHAPTASGSESPLIPSLASHLTPICNTPAKMLQPHRRALKRALPQSQPRQLPRHSLQGQSAPRSRLQSSTLTPSQCYRPSQAKQIGPGLRSGISGTRPNSVQGGEL